MHDPGEPPLEGSLLIARVGRGTYVYTALSFFRQLPAGVPGAFRLFANLLALGRRPGREGSSLRGASVCGCCLGRAGDGRTPVTVYSPHGRDQLLLHGARLRAAEPGHRPALAGHGQSGDSRPGSAWSGSILRPTSGSAGRRRSSPGRWASRCSRPTGRRGPTTSTPLGIGPDDMYCPVYSTPAVIAYNSEAVPADSAPAGLGRRAGAAVEGRGPDPRPGGERNHACHLGVDHPAPGPIPGDTARRHGVAPPARRPDPGVHPEPVGAGPEAGAPRGTGDPVGPARHPDQHRAGACRSDTPFPPAERW